MMATTAQIAFGVDRGVLPLLARALVRDPIDEALFLRKVLTDSNFAERGSIMARLDGKVVGYALALRRQVPLENALDDKARGYIALLAVDERHRRSGIGSQLLMEAEAYLAGADCKEVAIAPYAPNYFAPGVDVHAYNEGLSFLKNRGYLELYRPISMQVDLWDVREPAWLQERRSSLAGVEFVPLCLETSLPLIRFAEREFPGDWVRVVRETAREIASGARPDRLIAAMEGGAGLGFSHYDGERFGPIGVAASQRGRCLGQLLMYETLLAQKRAGYKSSWFMWSDDATAARIYSAAGFREVRRFAVLKKTL